MLPINSRSLVLAALVGGVVAPAFSETIFQLKNGDRVTGRILSEDTNQVVVTTIWAKEMALPLSQISKREDITAPATNALPVLSATNAPALGTTNLVAGTTNLVAGTTNLVAGTTNLVAGTTNLVAGTTNLAGAAPTNAAEMTQLADLLRRYRTDQIAPHKYYEERAKILAQSETKGPALNGTNAVALNGTNAVALNGTNAVALNGTNAVAINSTNAPALNGTNAPVVARGTNAPAGSPTNAVLGANSPVKPKKPKQWFFDLQAGLSLQYNQKSYENFSGLAKVDYNNPDLLRNTVEYHGAYGRTEGIVSVNRMDIANRTEHDIDKARKAFVFNAFGIGYDAIRDIDLTYDDSLGVGYKLYKTPTFALSGDIGANYQRQYFSAPSNPLVITDQRSTEYFSLRLGEQISWAINKRVSFDEKSEFYPHLDLFGAYRFRIEGNLNIKLNDPGTVYLVFAMIDIYDTHPAKTITRNDLQISARVGMKF